MRRLSIHLILLIVLLSSFVLSVGPAGAQDSPAGAAPAAGTPLGPAFIYQGRLERGGSPVTAACSMAFKLMDNPTGAAAQIGGTLNKSVAVANGLFSVELDFGGDAFPGDGRFLDITVNCGSGAETLTPRQTLSAAPYALGVRPGTRVSAGGATLYLIGCAQGLAAAGGDAPAQFSNCSALMGWNSSYNATATLQNEGSGVALSAGSGAGGAILAWASASSRSPTIDANNYGSGAGVSTTVKNNNAVNATNNSTYAAVFAKNNGAGYGVAAEAGAGMALYGKNTGNNPALRLQNDASGALVSAITWSGDIIQGWERLDASNSNYNLRFRVSRLGDVRADGTYASPASDLADLLPAATGLEPGDVLVIGADGRLTRSTGANATHVAGVFATKPAFLGGMTEDANVSTLDAPPAVTPQREAESEVGASLHAGGPSPAGLPTGGPKRDDQPLAQVYREQGLAPLALAGVVPVKVSAENGAIRPGDLLTSAALPGHAMRAAPVDIGGIALYRPGTIIGKALEGLDAGAGTIKVLVSLQ